MHAHAASRSRSREEDGKLSYEEFKAFAMSEPKVTATLNGFKKEVPVTLV